MCVCVGGIWFKPGLLCIFSKALKKQKVLTLANIQICSTFYFLGKEKWYQIIMDSCRP